MSDDSITRQTNTGPAQDELSAWVAAFLVARKAENLTPGTIRYYRQKIKLFTDYCKGRRVTRVSEITPDIIRRFLLHLAETNHNAGGCHSAFRSLRAFLLWYEAEAEPEGWRNPIRKVRAPRVPDEVIEPVPLADVQAMVAACPTDTFTGLRDRALLWCLLDTGCRAMELLAQNVDDIDATTGTVLIRQGKGHKPRTVFMGRRARRSWRAYLQKRKDENRAAWLNVYGERLRYDGLREIFERRAALAGVPCPSAHDFRRAFALSMLRNGCDLITLMRLLGHSSLAVLKRYLRQVDEDLLIAHRRAGPVDRLEGER